MRFYRYVIVYDISDSKIRDQVFKLLKGVGEPVNYSVFECELKKKELKLLRDKIKNLIDPKKDVVIYYPLCLNCLARVLSDGLVVPRNLDKIVLSV